jgi:hypothetical protein
VIDATTLGLPPDELQPRVSLERMFVPAAQGICEFISGESASAIADGLVARLRGDRLIGISEP